MKKDYLEYMRSTEKPMKYKAFKKALYKQMDKELKQKILDSIRKPMKFGEICKKFGVTLDEVCSVFEANLKKSCIAELNKEAI